MQDKIKLKKRCSFLRKNCLKPTSKKLLIIDDEFYLGLDREKCSGNKGFYSANISHCPVNIRRREKEKYPQKVLVLLAIDENGKICEPIFMKKATCWEKYI